MAGISQEQKASVRAELDSLHRGMVVDLDRRMLPVEGDHEAGAEALIETENLSDIISLVKETVDALRTYHQDLDRLQDEKASYISNIEDLHDERQSLINKVDEMSSVIKNSRQQIDSLTAEVGQLKSTVAALSKQRDNFAQNLVEAAQILKSNLAELRYGIE